MNRTVLIIGIFVLVFSTISFSGAAQEKKETISLDLSYHQLNEDLPVLKISAKTKKGKRFEAVGNEPVNLYFNTESAADFIGRITTNDKGFASIRLPSRFGERWNALPAYTFIATVTGSHRFDDASLEVEIIRARINLTLAEEDSTRMIYAKVFAREDSIWKEEPETDVRLIVRRLLSDLNAGDEEFYTTDESGTVSATFEMVITGDLDGVIQMGAKIDEHPSYGTLITTKPVKWGVPRVVDHSFEKRTLWATRDKTPLWLLIFPNLIIAGVWGMIFYLLYLIYRISKLGKTEESSKNH